MRTVGLFLRVEARSARNVSNEVVSADSEGVDNHDGGGSSNGKKQCYGCQPAASSPIKNAFTTAT